MKFIELLETEMGVLEAHSRVYTMKLVLEEGWASNKSIEELSEGVEHLNEAYLLYEAIGELSDSEIKKAEEVIDDTAVQLFSDKNGKRSFAIKSKNKVTYVMEDGERGSDITMTLPEWNKLEKALKDTGVRPVTGKLSDKWLKAIVSTLKWVSISVVAVVAVAAILVAGATGVSYTHATLGAIGKMAKIGDFLANPEALQLLLNGGAAKMAGGWLVGMGRAVGSALKGSVGMVARSI